uniref:Growth-blocking peptide n=1 Tax=Mamestra brassicae TaxID=55057 RepID=O96060_MAMBR|nr:growth-blocking peptide [Mamestra brassicae]BAD20459.1 growth-blocking peptide [Mamestra brassicae]BAD20460.1 growth-blocking peptide [Mamestra brassicae]BAD20461.1 growth-blocking peptide [Mamestra brassicae]BAJ21212.1 precursor of insect cytokine growth blocking peptide [Mamestra brassicae]
MKLTITILFCVILTLQYNGADAQFKDLFGKIHDSVHGTADKVKQDLNTIFNPNAKKQQENKDESSNIHFVEDESEEDFAAAAAARKPVEVTPAPEASETTIEPVTSSTPLASSENATTLAPSTTTVKGRENFAGGCLTGFMRTPDGRCKPTF